MAMVRRWLRVTSGIGSAGAARQVGRSRSSGGGQSPVRGGCAVAGADRGALGSAAAIRQLEQRLCPLSPLGPGRGLGAGAAGAARRPRSGALRSTCSFTAPPWPAYLGSAAAAGAARSLGKATAARLSGRTAPFAPPFAPTRRWRRRPGAPPGRARPGAGGPRPCRGSVGDRGTRRSAGRGEGAAVGLDAAQAGTPCSASQRTVPPVATSAF